MKDISTVRYQPQRPWEWQRIAREMIPQTWHELRPGRSLWAWGLAGERLGLFEQPDRQRASVAYALAGFNRPDYAKDQRENQDDEKQEKADDNKD